MVVGHDISVSAILVHLDNDAAARRSIRFLIRSEKVSVRSGKASYDGYRRTQSFVGARNHVSRRVVTQILF